MARSPNPDGSYDRAATVNFGFARRRDNALAAKTAIDEDTDDDPAKRRGNADPDGLEDAEHIMIHKLISAPPYKPRKVQAKRGHLSNRAGNRRVSMAVEPRLEALARRVFSRWLLSAAAFVAAAAFAATSPAQAQESKSSTEARVIVFGEGSASATPDYAWIRGGVTSNGKTAKEATDANSKLIAAITAALLSSGIDQKDIRTSRFFVQPVYIHQQNAEPKFSGFNATNQLTITIRQIAKLGDILDRLVTAGATEVGNIEFLQSDPATAFDRARQAAIADAQHKAELYAQAAGLRLGSVVWITEDIGSGSTPFSPLAAKRVAAQAAMPVQISPGEDTLRVVIAVGYGVAP
jgi:uncharacterized protein